MDNLPKDMVFKLADELSPQDFISFCSSNTAGNISRVCGMVELWDKRLRKDFPYIMEKFQGVGDQDPKSDYLEIFKRISKMAETFTEIVLADYGELRKFFNPEFQKLLYKGFYDLCTTAVRDVLKVDYNDADWITDSVSDSTHNENYKAIKANYFPGMKGDEQSFQDYWYDKIDPHLEEFLTEMINFLKEY